MGWGTGVAPTIDDNVEPPKSVAAPPRTRNPRSKKVNKAAEGILQAINFVEGACKDELEYQSYCRIAAGWIVAYDGSMAAGHPIDADIAVCPHVRRLKEAVTRAGATMALTAQENGRLGVSGAKARFTVPCLPGSSLHAVMPDPAIAVLDDRLKAAFAATISLAKDDAETIHEQSLLLRANTVVGCNGTLAIEAYHGIDLPPGLGIPHKAAKVITKQQSPLVAFGIDWGRSVTFHFENGAWIKTQLMAGEWPDVDRVLNQPAYYAPTPEGLFEGLDAILSFSEDGAVHFHDDKLRTTYSDGDGGLSGATYDVPGLQKGHSLTGRLLKLTAPYATQIDYTTNADALQFLNPELNVRGVLMKRIV